VSRWVGAALAMMAFGCSGLTEGEAGVVGIEVGVPGPDTVEVGETIQLSARPLNKDGDSAAASVTWISTDLTSAVIDPAGGALTGVSRGTTRVQATVGSLGSDLILFTVVAPADTLAISGDSILAAASDDAAVLPSLVTLVSSFTAGALSGRAVVYTITSPDPGAGTPTVLLGGSVVSDTLFTGSEGTAVATLVKAAGVPPPDSIVVTVQARRTRGATVAGSGQRFIVRFTP
jgi:hypothetical protein